MQLKLQHKTWLELHWYRPSYCLIGSIVIFRMIETNIYKRTAVFGVLLNILFYNIAYLFAGVSDQDIHL